MRGGVSGAPPTEAGIINLLARSSTGCTGAGGLVYSAVPPTDAGIIKAII
tara:strand:+ start:12904 stop:13053 length:150 start_codon:yes stop_codon:yes gene_type:complete